MTRFTWRPVVGAEVEVLLSNKHPRRDAMAVKLASNPDRVLGYVFADSVPIRGYHFCRHDVIETRGSHLVTCDAAVSALLFCLRQEGKV